MIESTILTERYPNGEIQKTQVLRFDDWTSLRFFRGAPDPGALAAYARIYRKFLVPASPKAFGRMALVQLPAGLDVSAFGIGPGADPLLSAASCLREGVSLRKDGSPAFRTETARLLWDALEREGCVEIVCGELPFTRILPVRSDAFQLSRNAGGEAMLVNASFFVFDPFDCATRYDAIGTPFGLAVKDGKVLQPPLFGREALIVRADGSVSVETPALKDLGIVLGGRAIRAGETAEVFSRPARRRTPQGSGFDHVITGCRVLDVVPAGVTEIPAAGFVLRLPERAAGPGDDVRYTGMEDVRFAVQAGNSLMKDGVKTDRFVSGFYDIHRPWRTPFPPCLYPLDYDRARAARIAVGADKDGKPMILWAEGAAKIGYRPGEGSCGASLAEFAAICEKAGMRNGVNLDGGGSAEILLNGVRTLAISDRSEDGAETERFVPLGLAVSNRL